MLDARTGDSLAKTDQFASSLKLVDKNNAALMWLNVAGIRGFAETLIPAADKTAYGTDLKPYVAYYVRIDDHFVYAPGDTLDRTTLVIRGSGN